MFVDLVLLPLRYTRPAADGGLVPYYTGLILIPAGPGIVRRIGMFTGLKEHVLGNVAEQEITIV